MKVISIEKLKEILSALPANPRVVASGNFATPTALLQALDLSVEKFKLHMLNAQEGIPDRPGVEYESAFVGPGMRHSKRLTYIPSRLSLVPVLFRDHFVPDLVLLNTSRQLNGKVSLGTEVNILPAAIDAVHNRGGLVIAQANSRMPYTFGDSEIPVDQIDYLVEVDQPLATKPPANLSDETSQIGDLIATRITDGSTLQLGIGAIPDSVLSALGSRSNLKIWTEMFSDGVLELERTGALDSQTPITASFVFGNPELYEWLDQNPRVHMVRTETSNDPSMIARQPKMTSINSALQVDLFDQANASHVRGEIYSGFGGSTDFIVGALHSPGGASFMALQSWHPKANKSSIVSQLTESVTSFQHSFVVTENGVADCFGHSQKEQALNLINQAAHPSVRQELTRAASELKLI